MTSAEVDVRTDGVTVAMKVMVEDLVLFHRLTADSESNFDAVELREAARKHQAFILEYFTLRDAGGARVDGRVTAMDASVITDAGVALEDLMKRQVLYELAFDLPGAQPFLTFLQQFGGTNAPVPSITDFSVSQNGIWIDTPRQVSGGDPFTIAFDWDNPPAAPPANWAELKKQRAEEFQRRLGITSYTGLYSYIYVTDQELRHEILVPLLTFETWLPVPRTDKDFLSVEEQSAVRQAVASFFQTNNPVLINNRRVVPRLERLQFFGLDINDFARNAPPRPVSVYQARLGIILSYRAPSRPDDVEMKWVTYTQAAGSMRSYVFVDEAPAVEQFFVPDRPQWAWKRQPAALTESSRVLPPTVKVVPWSVPVFSLAVLVIGFYGVRRLRWFEERRRLGAVAVVLLALACWPLPAWKLPASIGSVPPLQSPEARMVAGVLLDQVYRAFHEKEEESVYDALDEAVAGPLLESLYLELRARLRVEEQGGAIARVTSVALEDVSVLNATPAGDGYAAYETLCRWKVSGTVEHWGHVHRRENRYTAKLTLAGTPDGWRLTGYDLHDEELLRVVTSIRD